MDLAEKLNVSRKAISRWKVWTVAPSTDVHSGTDADVLDTNRKSVTNLYQHRREHIPVHANVFVYAPKTTVPLKAANYRSCSSVHFYGNGNRCNTPSSNNQRNCFVLKCNGCKLIWKYFALLFHISDMLQERVDHIFRHRTYTLVQ